MYGRNKYKNNTISFYIKYEFLATRLATFDKLDFPNVKTEARMKFVWITCGYNERTIL